MTQATPSFLGRTRKPKQVAGNAKSNQPSAHPTSDAAIDELMTSAAAKSKSAGKGQASGKRTGAGAKMGKQSRRVSVPPSPELTSLLRAAATRPEMVDAVEGAHPGALTGAVVAMTRGAQIAGPSGVADRSALWRMVGMPWVGEGGGKMARDLGAALGAAYGEAVSRLEGHRRHKPVTVAEPMALEGTVDSHS